MSAMAHSRCSRPGESQPFHNDGGLGAEFHNDGGLVATFHNDGGLGAAAAARRPSWLGRAQDHQAILDQRTSYRGAQCPSTR
jgi:hypothetical protein